jgi:hypothetical protein
MGGKGERREGQKGESYHMHKSFRLRPEKQKGGRQMERKKIESFEDLLVWQKGINLVKTSISADRRW